MPDETPVAKKLSMNRVLTALIGRLHEVKLSGESFMKPVRQLMDTSSQLATPQACLFTLLDLRSVTSATVGG
jgi:hypothetical protein